MKKIIVITGLPGSGKSTYINNTYRNKKGYQLIADDYQANAVDNSPEFEKSRHYDNLLNTLPTNDIPIISDLRYCSKSEQLKLIESVLKICQNIIIVWVCLTTNSITCKINIERRNRPSKEKEKNLVDEYSKIYEIPKGAKKILFNYSSSNG